jgi:arylsulfatase
MATCVDLAQAEYPETFEGHQITPLAGKSLLPIFDGKTWEPHARLFWEHEGNRAVREGRWKLVATRQNEWELYDLEADRTELHNLAKEQPDRAAALLKTWEVWAAGCGVKT